MEYKIIETNVTKVNVSVVVELADAFPSKKISFDIDKEIFQLKDGHILKRVIELEIRDKRNKVLLEAGNSLCVAAKAYLKSNVPPILQQQLKEAIDDFNEVVDKIQ